MAITWTDSNLIELAESSRTYSSEDYLIKTYKGKLKIFRAKRGWWKLSKKLPLYILIEINGLNDEAGLHYYERGFRFYAKTGQSINRGIFREEFKECLQRSGLDSLKFFTSLDNLVNGEEKKNLEKLIKILNPNYLTEREKGIIELEKRAIELNEREKFRKKLKEEKTQDPNKQ